MYQKGLCSLGSACREYHGNFELKNFDEKNYKTKMCEAFEKGDCPLGKICTKAHGEEELEYYRAELGEGRQMKQEEEKPESKEQQIVLKLVPF